MKRIILVLLIGLLAGCNNTKYYDSSEEAWSQEYSGLIEDLEFCDIMVIDYEGEDFWFAFIGLENIDECLNVMNSCNTKDKCTWRVDVGARKTDDTGWRTKYTGRCICRPEK